MKNSDKFVMYMVLLFLGNPFSYAETAPVDSTDYTSTTLVEASSEIIQAASEPDLVNALIALKNHVLGSPALSGPQIAAHMATIESDQALFGSSSGVMSAAFDLVDTYDSQIAPLWSSGSPVNEFNRNTVSTQDIHWVVYNVMQHLMDYSYTSANLTTHAAVLEGQLFGCSARFPGAVAPPAVVTHTATINASYPATAGRLIMFDELPARKPTGTYVAPGTIVTVKVPASIVGKGYQVRVGAHSWDFEEENRPRILRLDRSTILYDINSTEIEVGSPLGGGIYIEVPYLANEGVVSVEITGAVRSPFYSNNTVTGHITTLSEWQNTERLHPAPWADFQTERCMIQVPTDWIYKLDDPIITMAEWDSCIDSINDLMGFPRERGKETMYMQVDLQIRFQAYSPGYPMANDVYNPNTNYNGLANNYLVSGPRNAPYWVFHELGHAYLFKKFGFESESHVNLLHVAAWNQGLGIDLDTAFRNSAINSSITFRTLDRTAIEWMTSFNFSPNDRKMSSYEKNYRLKGHAKYVDMARLFGWQAVNDFQHQLVLDGVHSTSPVSDDDLIVRLALAAGVDLRPLLHFWGVHPNNPEAVANAIAAAGLEVSNEIYDQIWFYRSQIPADNAAFQDFVSQWWNGPPSINGGFTEGQHARQWDSTELWDQGEDRDRAPLLPNGEIYDESSHDRVTARVDTILALYFPDGDPAPDTDPPTPDAAQFLEAPAAVDQSSISMTAVTGSDASGRVEYLFTEISGNPGGSSSGWQTSPSYTDTGLNAATIYTYTVTMRDSTPNTGTASAPASATTHPDPVTWTAATPTSVTIKANPAGDGTSLQYYFANRNFPDGSHDSGWQDNRTYVDSGLTPFTSYLYQVTVRDTSSIPPEWISSSLLAAVTDPDPAIITPTLSEGPLCIIGSTNAPASNANFKVSVVPGMSIYTGTGNNIAGNAAITTFSSFGDGAVLDYRFFNEGPGETIQAYGFGSSSRISNVTSPNTSITNRSFTNVWTTTDPGDDFTDTDANFTSNTAAGFGNSSVSGTIDISGMSKGIVYFIYGSYRSTPNISLIMSGPGQDPVPLNGVGDNDFANNFENYIVPVSFLNAGDYDTISYTLNSANGWLAGVVLDDALRPAALSPYDTWSNGTGGSFLGTLINPSADLDFDNGGLKTGIEWVLGGDPTDPSDDAGLAPVLSQDTANLIFTFTRSGAANDDPNTIIKVEYGTDLLGWDEAEDGVDGVSITVTPGNPSDTVQVSIPKTLADPGSKLFVRLNAALTAP